MNVAETNLAEPKASNTDSVPALRVGEQVLYVPHTSHSFNCDLNNRYPWVIGLRQNPHYKTNPETGEKELIEDVVEIEEGHLHRSVLPGICRHPNPKEERKRLVPLRPNSLWPAVVRRVHADGSADLDIDSNVGNGMVTLHYSRVPCDPEVQTPHSYSRRQS